MAEKKIKNHARREAAVKRILALFMDRYPNKVHTKEIEKVARISDYQRRIRDLRAEGWQILSHHDDSQNLHLGEYRLGSLVKDKGYKFTKRVDARTRAYVLQRNGYTCYSCGRGTDDKNPLNPNRNTVLNVDHIDADGPSTPENLRVLCSACNSGKQDLILAQSSVNLLRSVRRSSIADQKAVFEWLKRKFEKK